MRPLRCPEHRSGWSQSLERSKKRPSTCFQLDSTTPSFDGLRPTVGYIDLAEIAPASLAEHFIEKLRQGE